MTLVKILKRKDASSIIIAIVLAMIVMQVLQSLTSDMAATISDVKNEEGFFGGVYAPPEAGWQQLYLYPVVWALLQIIALEILAWLVTAAGSAMKVPAKKRN